MPTAHRLQRPLHEPSRPPLRGPLHRQVVDDPRSGEVLTVRAGTRLGVRFRRTLSSWRVEDLPGHLVPLEQSSHGFEFLVFATPDATGRPLRLVRQRADRSGPGEVREVIVLVTP